MENKHFKLLIAIVTAPILFLNQDFGVNLGIFGFILGALTLYPFSVDTLKSVKWELLMYLIGLASFAWYGDEISFMASWCSFFLIQLKLFYPQVRLFPGVVLVIMSFVATPIRFWFFKQWMAFTDMREGIKKIVYLGLIPLLFLLCFLGIYALANQDLELFLSRIHIDEKFFEVIRIMIVVFLVLFNAWYIVIPQKFWSINAIFADEWGEKSLPSASTNRDYILKSGIASFVVLSVLITVMIALQMNQLYQFLELSDLSHHVHKSVTALIISLLMAIGVVLVYFNTKIEDSYLKQKLILSAHVWLVLNSVLIALTFFQNMQYVYHFGLTFQRIGVFLFLFLSAFGLLLAFVKIKKEKSNGFVINRMLKVGLWILVICAPINFSKIVTRYNLNFTSEKDIDYLKTLEFNDKILGAYLKKNEPAVKYAEWEKIKIQHIEKEKKESFLAGKLYYKTLDF